MSIFGECLAAIGIVYTLVVSFKLVVPQLNAWGKAYYFFLMAWTVPYAIGYVCDKQHLGSLWVRWHLVDMSYVQWSTTLGVTAYVVVAKFLGWSYTQRSILIVSIKSIVFFTIGAYIWETGQGWLEWLWYGRMDLSDDIYYSIGLAVAAAPFIALRRSLAASAQAV